MDSLSESRTISAAICQPTISPGFCLACSMKRTHADLIGDTYGSERSSSDPIWLALALSGAGAGAGNRRHFRGHLEWRMGPARICGSNKVSEQGSILVW